MTPIEGVDVYCELCGEETHSWSVTDSRGIYSFTGVWTTPGVRTPVWFSKEDTPIRPEFLYISISRAIDTYSSMAIRSSMLSLSGASARGYFSGKSIRTTSEFCRERSNTR